MSPWEGGGGGGGGGGHRLYAQKVRGGSESPEPSSFVAELEGGMDGLRLSSGALDAAKQTASSKKGKRSIDMAAMAQAVVNESRVPLGKRKIRVLSLGTELSTVFIFLSFLFSNLIMSV